MALLATGRGIEDRPNSPSRPITARAEHGPGDSGLCNYASELLNARFERVAGRTKIRKRSVTKPRCGA